jgi:hypothetical protein
LVYRSIFSYLHFQKLYEPYPATKKRNKEFLPQVAKDWAADKREAVEPESDSMQPGPSTITPCRPHGEPLGRHSGHMWKHVLEKIVKSEKAQTWHLLVDTSS